MPNSFFYLPWSKPREVSFLINQSNEKRIKDYCDYYRSLKQKPISSSGLKALDNSILSSRRVKTKSLNNDRPISPQRNNLNIIKRVPPQKMRSYKVPTVKLYPDDIYLVVKKNDYVKTVKMQASFEALLPMAIRKQIAPFKKPGLILTKEMTAKIPVIAEQRAGASDDRRYASYYRILAVLSLSSKPLTVQEIADLTRLRSTDVSFWFPDGIPYEQEITIHNELTDADWLSLLGSERKALLDKYRLEGISELEFKKLPIFEKFGSGRKLNPSELEFRRLAVFSVLYLLGPMSQTDLAEYSGTSPTRIKQIFEKTEYIPGIQPTTEGHLYSQARFELADIFEKPGPKPSVWDLSRKYNLSPYYIDELLPEDHKLSNAYELLETRIGAVDETGARYTSETALNEMVDILVAHKKNVSNGIFCESCNIQSNKHYKVEQVCETDHIFGKRYNKLVEKRVICGCCHNLAMGTSLDRQYLPKQYQLSPVAGQPINYSTINMWGPHLNNTPEQNNWIKNQIENKLRKFKNTRNFKKGCEKCGVKTWKGIPIDAILELHHIDGNHYNNNPNNWAALCPNCHDSEHFVNNWIFNKQTKRYKTENTRPAGVNFYLLPPTNPAIRLVDAVLRHPNKPKTKAGCARLLGLSVERFEALVQTHYPSRMRDFDTGGRRVGGNSFSLTYEERLQVRDGIRFNDLIIPEIASDYEPEALARNKLIYDRLQTLKGDKKSWSNTPIEPFR